MKLYVTVVQRPTNSSLAYVRPMPGAAIGTHTLCTRCSGVNRTPSMFAFPKKCWAIVIPVHQLRHGKHGANFGEHLRQSCDIVRQRPTPRQRPGCFIPNSLWPPYCVAENSVGHVLSLRLCDYEKGTHSPIVPMMVTSYLADL